MGGCTCLRGREFEYKCCILDGSFAHLFVTKLVLMSEKAENKTKKRLTLAYFFKKNGQDFFDSDQPQMHSLTIALFIF